MDHDEDGVAGGFDDQEDNNLFGNEDGGDQHNEVKAVGAVETVKPKKKRLKLTEEVVAKELWKVYDEFPAIRFQGKGHETSDLKKLLSHYKEWAYGVYPSLAFGDFIDRVDNMGSKRLVHETMSEMRERIRLRNEQDKEDDAHSPDSTSPGDPSEVSKNPETEFPSINTTKQAEFSHNPELVEPETVAQRIERNRLAALAKRAERERLQASTAASSTVSPPPVVGLSSTASSVAASINQQQGGSTTGGASNEGEQQQEALELELDIERELEMEMEMELAMQLENDAP